MAAAASFAERWAREHLRRPAPASELAVLRLFLDTCGGDAAAAARRARRYYAARGPRGAQLWRERAPDDEDVLRSCQDAYIVPLKARSVRGRRVTLVRLPAPRALDRPLDARALLARWLMIMDIRLHEDPTPGEEIVVLDVGDLQPQHITSHFRGDHWSQFIYIMKKVYPIRCAEVHVINTHRLKALSLLLLRVGLAPWRRRRRVALHPRGAVVSQLVDSDCLPAAALPLEYGGKAGGMKDLNDEWTKKLLTSARWLRREERKFHQTQLPEEVQAGARGARGALGARGRGQYDMSASGDGDLDEWTYGEYRTLRGAL